MTQFQSSTSLGLDPIFPDQLALPDLYYRTSNRGVFNTKSCPSITFPSLKWCKLNGLEAYKICWRFDMMCCVLRIRSCRALSALKHLSMKRACSERSLHCKQRTLVVINPVSTPQLNINFTPLEFLNIRLPIQKLAD